MSTPGHRKSLVDITLRLDRVKVIQVAVKYVRNRPKHKKVIVLMLVPLLGNFLVNNLAPSPSDNIFGHVNFFLLSSIIRVCSRFRQSL